MPSVDGVNYPGPWEIRVKYTCVHTFGTVAHELRMNVDVDADPGAGSDFVDYDLESRAGLVWNAKTWTDEIIGLVKVAFKTSSTFVVAELWKYLSGSYNAAFQSSYSLGVTGTSVQTTQPMQQSILTCRSQNGGILKFTMMETVNVAGATDAYPTADSAINDIFDALVDVNSPVLARDGGYCFAPLNWLPGDNERLFKNYFR